MLFIFIRIINNVKLGNVVVVNYFDEFMDLDV